MSTDNRVTVNRLTAGEVARLTLWLIENIEEVRGKGFATAAGIANAQLPFGVTEPNVRNLCTSDGLPQLAVIHPRANKDEALESLNEFKEMALEQTAAVGKLSATVRAMAARIDHLENSWVSHGAAVQGLRELTDLVANEKDIKPWAVRWQHNLRQILPAVVRSVNGSTVDDGGVCGND